MGRPGWQYSTTQSGQALLIILLVLAVALTVVLSVISRSVTDIAVTTKEREAARAFSAAEAGVEEALIGGSLSGSFAGGGSYTVVVGGLAEGGTEFPAPGKVAAGDAIPIWFVSHADDGSLTCADGKCFTGSSMRVCWGESGTSAGDAQTPALEVVIIYTATAGNYETTRVARAAFDPNSGRRASNQFAAPDAGTCSIGDQDYAFSKTINFTDLGVPSSVYNTQNGLQTARLRLLYNTQKPHPVGASVGTPLPAQGTRIESTGIAGAATRKIEVFQLYSDLPPIFDFALFTLGDLTK